MGGTAYGLGYRDVKSGFVVPTDLDPIERHPKAVRPGERMRMHNPMCYGCGEDSPHGLHLEMYAGEDFTVTAAMTVETHFEGGPGVLHGGILTTAFDDVMGMAPLLVGPSAVTVHLEVDFLRPIPVGSTLQFRATLLGRQRRKLYTEGVAHIGDPDQPVATAHAIFVSINAREHFAEHIDKSQISDEYKQRLSRP
ncbi:PaaI family thioesterase [Gordonia hankookensis]|uniref:Acyl-coenzyme A thioesterase THEM4 n=1 Tax=Gordonia hankookensis TaxID=589403 RepID=A0ABR7W8P6_9ACTN|nr:PaaI family thioesterase [Gordonia hankookensis]MBD1319143.1 PaaI family thioesterase [Gordonia hankookensis]NDZ93514.1 PaaI family thioesterase [Streptomyces sp. SID11726]NEB27298.1 PaaI family thioesterase [Streptomyces sp. SID6673]